MSDNKTKIVHVLWSLNRAGAELLLLDFIRHADASSYKHEVVCLSGENELEPDYNQLGVTPHFFPKPNRLFNIVNLIKAANAIRKINPDILHLHRSGNCVLFLILHLLAPKPVLVATEHQIFDLFGKPTLWQVLIRRLSKHRFAQTITISDGVKQSLLKYKVVSEQTTTTIQNAIQTARFPAVTEGTCIGSLGRLVDYKGHDVFIRALGMLRDRGYTFKALIGGSGQEADNLTLLIQTLKLEDQVTLCGEQQDAASFFAQCSTFVLPSRTEGFGIVLIEAMCSALPVIATRLDTLQELVTEGQTGLLFDSENHEQLADQLVVMLNDKAKAKQMGQAGRAHVLEHFDIQVLADRYEAVYQKALST